MNPYQSFLESKTQLGGNHGFSPVWMPDFLFDFQKHLTDWNLSKGRSATLADCGLGKTPMELVWAENIVRKTNKPVLILTVLGVAAQFVSEAEKFGIEVELSRNGKFTKKIVITNYERIHYFNPEDFEAVACDESSILKNFDGKTKAQVTEFLRLKKYRSLWTATSAPNDYIELGTHSEALGEMGYMDMLSRFFKNDQNSNHPNRQWSGGKWRFRGHAEKDFWRWVVSWARAVRKPSDLGFPDGNFILPPLQTREHLVESKTLAPGSLLPMPAMNRMEEIQERRRTLNERCEKAASLVCENKGSSLSWCNLNDEGDMLAKLIPDSVQVSGSDEVEFKEETLQAFRLGQIKRLITKVEIAGFGSNFQNCAHQTWFPDHSFEQYYQGVRRSWRFGQTQPVVIDRITSEGQSRVLANLDRKKVQAEEMFAKLVELMNNELRVEKSNPFTKKAQKPLWL